MISAVLVGDHEVLARLQAMPAAVHAMLLQKVYELDLRLEAKVKAKLSGQVLQVRTGALRRSIRGTVEDQPSRVIGKVASSGDVKYAAIHEFGGRTKAHVIEPRKAQALAFVSNGKQVFARRVNHPGSQMPERSFLRSSLREMKAEIITGLKGAVLDGLRSARP